MSNLIKISNKVINLDNVTEIVDISTDLVRVRFNVLGGENNYPDSTDFDGEDAATLRWYLSNWQVIDVAKDKYAAEICHMEGCENPKTPKNDYWCKPHLDEMLAEESYTDIPF